MTDTLSVDANQPSQILVIHSSEAKQYGCPYCGCWSGKMMLRAYDTFAVLCDQCTHWYAVLADTATESRITFDNDDHQHTSPVQVHPRRGILAHRHPHHLNDETQFRDVGVDVFEQF